MELESVADRDLWSEPKQMTISPAVAEQWNEVGKVHSLRTDTEIASFLLHLYRAGVNSSGSVSCMVCKKSLSVAFCLPCAISYRAASGSLLEVERQTSASTCRMMKRENNNHNKDDEDAFVKVHVEDIGIQARPEENKSPAAVVCKRRRGRPRKTPVISCGAVTEPVAPNAALDQDCLRLKLSRRLQSCASKRRRTCSERPAQLPAPLSHFLPKFHRVNEKESQLKQSKVVLRKKRENKLRDLASQVLHECCAEKDSSHLTKVKASSSPDEPTTSERENEDNNHASMVNTKTGLVNSPRPAAVKCSKIQEKGTKRADHSTARTKETGVRKGRKGGVHPCDLCDSVFKEQYLLKRHIAIHSKDHGKDWEYHCQQCTRSFKKKGALDAHLRTHTGQKLFICAVCSEPFALTKQLKRHIQSKHSDVASTMACYKCSQCEATFARDRKLYIHVYRHTVEKKYQCEVCSKAFADAAMLKMHMRVHTDERPFTCTECGFSFRQLGSLTTHMQRHRGERNFTCHLCPVSYYSKFQLKMHLAAHKGEKSYLCQLCGAGYTNSKSLQIHMRSHTGERPFKCEVCGKDFARPSSFKQHKLTHSDTRPYSCAICAMTFVDNSNLHRHLRLKHSDKEKEKKHCATAPGSGHRDGERDGGDGSRETSGVEAPVSSGGSSGNDVAGEARIPQNPEQPSHSLSMYLKEQQPFAQVGGDVPPFGNSFKTSIGMRLQEGLDSLTNGSRAGLTGSSGPDMAASVKNEIDSLRQSGLGLHNGSVLDSSSRATEDRGQLQEVALHDLLTRHHFQYHYPC